MESTGYTITNSVLGNWAMTLTSDAAVDNVVAYIGTLTAPAAAATVQGDAAAGKALYATCATCHGPKGEGNVALNAPRLADQDDWYLVRQLQNYKKGIRGANPKDAYGAQMKPMAAMLADDAAINNVVESATSPATSALRVRGRTLSAPVVGPTGLSDSSTFRRLAETSGARVNARAVAVATASVKVSTARSKLMGEDACKSKGIHATSPLSNP